jgi:hypothetical protein
LSPPGLSSEFAAVEVEEPVATPRIFDNIEQHLRDALRDTLEVAQRADFCVGYFNLRGWKQLDVAIERWAGGEGPCCRLLVGMQRLPQDDLHALFRLDPAADDIDNSTALRLKKQLIEDFREQLTVGAPSNEDEAALRRLAKQIKARKVFVKLFLAYPLHAKLYLLFRPDKVNPATAIDTSAFSVRALRKEESTMNVTLSEEARAWVDHQVTRGYTSLDDYLEALIHRDREQAGGALVEVLLPLLVAARAGERRQIRDALFTFADPLSTTTVAFQQFEETSQEAYLLHALSLLESWGARAWPALKQLAQVKQPEVELFTGLIARCPGVSDEERLEALERLLNHPAASVRSSVMEHICAFPQDKVEPFLKKLLKHPNPEVRGEAAERLEC